jgi:hypothetical protein
MSENAAVNRRETARVALRAAKKAYTDPNFRNFVTTFNPFLGGDSYVSDVSLSELQDL